MSAPDARRRLAAAEHAPATSKADFEGAERRLRTVLLRLQYELADTDRAVLVVLAGDDLAGLHELTTRLFEWLDAREVALRALPPDHDGGGGPLLVEEWRALPDRGRIGVLIGGWAQRAVFEAARGEALGRRELAARTVRARAFERQIAAEGVVCLRLFLHQPEARLERSLERSREDPFARAFRASHALLSRWKRVQRVTRKLLDADAAGWTIVPSADDETRALAAGEALREALAAAVAGTAPVPAPAPEPAALEIPDRLATIAPAERLAHAAYTAERKRLQGELFHLAARAHERGIPAVLAFEGWDAAGKGGAIRRVMHAIPPWIGRVVPIAAPSEEERRRPWAWRFWRALPSPGRVTVFDRSWYGRVLVERVEGFAREDEWRRAYDEITDFEEQLVESGAALVKCWLELDPDEQLRRFQGREETPFKRYKLTPEDWRNRERRPAYVAAVNEMLARTDTELAPWTLVSADGKRHARLEVLRAVIAAFERALSRER